MNNLFFYLKQLLIKIKSFLSENNNLNWLNGIACFICAWFTFFPYPFWELFCVLASIPILGIAIIFFSKIIHINLSINPKPGKSEGKLNVFPLYIIIPSILLAVRIYIKFDCENYYSLLTNLGIAFLFLGIIFLLAYFPLKEIFRQQAEFYGLLGVCVLFYSYGVMFGINCMFDKSTPERFETRTIKKYTKGGGEYPETYHITVAPWTNHPYKENLQISEEEYELADKGDYIFINVQKGLLNISWYYRAPRK